MILVTYRFPPGSDLEKSAKMIAIGQSAGTWSPRYADREDRLKGHLAKVVSLMPGEGGGGNAVIAYPVSNCPDSIGSLLTAILGKYSMAGPVRIVDLKLPEDYGVRPVFGINGIRSLLGIFDRPLFMGIFKPSLGLTAEEHGEILREASFAGIDLMKDDEILPDIPECPSIDRLKAARKVFEELWRTSRRKVLYAMNLSGRADQVLNQARFLVSEGANALLLNVLSYGFPLLEALATDPEINVPVFCHPAMSGVFTGPTDYGMSPRVVLGTLMAHAGGDAVLFPTRFGNLPVEASEESELCSILQQASVFPVPSGGVNPGSLFPLCDAYGKDVILNAGTAIMDHPGGVGEGVSGFVREFVRYGWPMAFSSPFGKDKEK